ncbi:MAG: 2-oxoacid:acceptor oxidoreductase family protein [Fimbriimonadales bacterium]|nr:2-oxoacid:acceptor oxidoreductase family protein [Fimbriimonadales bacterium]
MNQVVFAGVGGQGILTIAKILAQAAAHAGFHVKQAEVHGMSQRGGAVQANVRFSREPVHTERILTATADLVVATEPLEGLRQLPMLREAGALVSGTNAVMNCTDYPPVERVLNRLAEVEDHVLLDLERLARAAGSARSLNVVALGAASWFLPFDPRDLENEVEASFRSKGPAVAAANVRAFRFGRNAASAYRDAMRRGSQRRAIQQWIESLPPEHLASEEPPSAAELEHWVTDPDTLSGAEIHAFEQALAEAHRQGRRRLLEHEVYALVELVGAISAPVHRFIPANDTLPPDELARFPGNRLVLKLASERIVHKSEAGGVVFADKTPESVANAIRELNRLDPGCYGVLAVEYVEPEYRGFGSELFVGIRATREFGPVIAAGLGGVETEYLASRMRPGSAVAHAVATETDAEGFLRLFQNTAAYDVLAGRTRGHHRLVSDAELLRCFRAFLAIARHFCVDRGEAAPDIGELEVNPFAFRHHRLVPLDGRGLMRTAPSKRADRPLEKVRRLVEPRRIAIVGVSSKSVNYGRIILRNLLRRRSPEELLVVKRNEEQIDGVRCVPEIRDLPVPTDLLVVAAPGTSLPDIVEQCAEARNVEAGILISGGVGESEGSQELGAKLQEALRRCREADGPVFVGPNCMGIVSRIGRYDTFFIPEERLPGTLDGESTGLGIVSQSGAFVVGRLSKLAHLRPVAAFSIGNQMDVTVSDAMAALIERPEVRTIAVYVEGFSNYDGVAFLRTVEAARRLGKSVILYKAGRTDAGQTAAAGHTASLAGDYDVCVAAAARSGALVAGTFDEFEMLMETAAFFDSLAVRGESVFALTNAGMEAVAIADQAQGREGLRLAELNDGDRAELRRILEDLGLDRLATPRNPLDLTPMGDELAYDTVAKWALSKDCVDALLVGCVPLAPNLRTLPERLQDEEAFPNLATGWLNVAAKPIAFVVDAGLRFDALVDALRQRGFPVFRTADAAARVVARYLAHRTHACRA